MEKNVRRKGPQLNEDYENRDRTKTIRDAQTDRDVRYERRTAIANARAQQPGGERGVIKPGANPPTHNITSGSTTVVVLPAYYSHKNSQCLKFVSVSGLSGPHFLGDVVHSPQTGVTMIVCAECRVGVEATRRITVLDCSHALASTIATHYYSCHKAGTQVRRVWLTLRALTICNSDVYYCHRTPMLLMTSLLLARVLPLSVSPPLPIQRLVLTSK
jgi:hypothetical protein